MLSRLIVAVIVLFSIAASSTGAPLYPLNDSTLLDTVHKLKLKNYAGARESALKAPATPERNFILGIASHRLEKWDEAAESLGQSLDGFTLLADYSLYYRADALFHLRRYEEAIQSLLKLKRDYPASPLARSASFLHADALFHGKNFSDALAAYQKYVESYPAGTKALTATLQAALCREALGDKEKAALELRGIWLKYPASPVAAQAENALQRLKSENVRIAPYTAEEIFSRGIILYDLQKYRQALETFSSLSGENLPQGFKARLELKIGQTLFKSRRFKDAEQILGKLAALPDGETTREAMYWLARTIDRTGNDVRAFELYTRLADSFPHSELADDALYYAALIKKSRGESAVASAILQRLVSRYPSSVLVPKSLWESAWNLYLAKDFKGAADVLEKLAENSAYREKALYWLGKAKDAAGEKEQAKTTFAGLVEEYPHGFYSLNYQGKSETLDGRISWPAGDTVSATPPPAGYERAKALIAFGLFDEARMELAANRKKVSGRSKLLEIARLYWEMKDYRATMGLFNTVSGNNVQVWNFSYPKAFSEHVSQFAEDYGVPESLAYSIIRAESSFYPSAVSPVGAVGLMQLMPATATFLHKGKSGKIGTAQLTNPELNIDLGIRHIQELIKRYDGNLVLAIAAYNSGSTPVDRWRKSFPALKSDEFIENIPYPETREYVKKVLTSMEIYKSLYGLDKAPGMGRIPSPDKKSASSGLALSTSQTQKAAGMN